MLIDHLLQELNEDPQNNRLVLMPLSRLVFDLPFNVGNFYFCSPGDIDLRVFRPIPNRTLETQCSEPYGDLFVTTLTGQLLREVSTSLTEFSIDTLNQSHLVAFVHKADWESVLLSNHQTDIALLKELSETAEKALDVIRFDYCRLDLPDTLPGIVGSWRDSGSYLGAMIYTPIDNESYLIAGEAVECSIVIKGIGLEVDGFTVTELPMIEDGEVSAIASLGLSLLSEAMESPNETMKFIRMMTLFEFLSSPDDYEKWQDVKKNIVCFKAETKQQYISLSERFREFSSKEIDGKQVGYRTLIVHQGKRLSDVIKKEKERNDLFIELQGYAGLILEDMIKHRTELWEDYKDNRKSMIRKLTS
jgi:hypothetical protein